MTQEKMVDNELLEFIEGVRLMEQELIKTREELMIARVTVNAIVIGNGGEVCIKGEHYHEGLKYKLTFEEVDGDMIIKAVPIE